jgi:outer membrane protein OmpA-like peptidoglycan-associated protein
MVKPKFCIRILILMLLSCLVSDAQDMESAYGIGTSFGLTVPRTDIKGPIESPIGRAFIRYYPSSKIGIEFGVGLGTIEAKKDTQFFTSTIYPFDVRFILQPVKIKSVTPYFYAGAGLLSFNPKDSTGKKLPRNARGDYKTLTSFYPLGFGISFDLSKSTTLGIAGTYNLTSTKFLDDIKTNTRDAYWSFTIDLFAYLKEQNPDLDGDGLLNDEERELKTDPLNPDTDGDGLRDGEEVHKYKTDPLNKDTDGDGLTDGEEVLTYHTDPLKKDTDGDGLNDGEEVLQYKTDPLKPDTDGDGLNDGDEVLKYKTNPLKVDTDGDGLSDGDEVLKYLTNPLQKDTDGDELSDGDEVLKYKTLPLKPDTDNGGMPDGKEIQLGLNPLDPSDDAPTIKVGERIILEGVNFETAKTTLLPEAMQILDQVAVSLATNPNTEVAIHGHTDNVGGAKYNMNLSSGRAESVKAYLVSKGIQAGRITTKGYGFTKPIADNTTAEGRAKNRRIEFVRVK